MSYGVKMIPFINSTAALSTTTAHGRMQAVSAPLAHTPRIVQDTEREEFTFFVPF